MTEPVFKSITVKASPERAFEVFTKGIDTWWPRTHHIGKSPMKEIIVEERAGGRCYSEMVDGDQCDWGQVLAWEPPQRFVMAWQVSNTWQYEPDLGKSSEVEVRFTPAADGFTLVELEHRYFERHGAGFETHRAMIDDPKGWSGTLQMFKAQVEKAPVEKES